VTGQRGEAMALLDGWDAAMLEDRPEPLIYATWMRALQTDLAADELGDLVGAFTHPNPIFLERVLTDTDGAAVWCDNRLTPEPETCAEVVATALDRALQRLAQSPGGALADLRWGAVHQATHDHPVLGGLPVIGRFVNIRQSTSGGDNTLLRGLTYGTGDAPLRNKHGALYRGVVDMAAPESSVFVISTGQSGHPLSPHYRDLAVLWRDGRYVSMALDPEVVRGEAKAVTRLLPE
jgi:penicillin amidase